MHARLLDMLHHTADERGAGSVADAIYVALDRVVQKTVQQHRRVVADLNGLAHVALQVALLMDNFHGAPAQHIAGAHY